MKKTVVITGGAGFIGSHIARAYAKLGYNLRIFDNFSSGKLTRLKDMSGNIQIIKGDILNKKAIQNACKGAHIVSHHAAQLEITTALNNPYHDITTNTIGTLHVLDACVTNGVKLLINASSACVYGQTQGDPSRETDPTNPNWPYGVSKLAAEKYCAIYSKRFSIPIISFRYAIIYGPNEWYGRAMTIFIKRAEAGLPLVVFGTGRQTRDFTHISTVVQANVNALAWKNKTHEIFNVSTGIGTSIKSLAQQISKLSKNHPRVIFDTKVKEGQKSRLINRIRIPQELEHLVLSPDKLSKVLNVRQTLSITPGLQNQIAWHQKNSHEWTRMSY